MFSPICPPHLRQDLIILSRIGATFNFLSNAFLFYPMWSHKGRWGTPPTYEYFFKPFHIQCRIFNTPWIQKCDQSGLIRGGRPNKSWMGSNVIIEYGSSLTQPHKIELQNERCVPLVNTLHSMTHPMYDSQEHNSRFLQHWAYFLLPLTRNSILYNNVSFMVVMKFSLELDWYCSITNYTENIPLFHPHYLSPMADIWKRILIGLYWKHTSILKLVAIYIFPLISSINYLNRTILLFTIWMQYEISLCLFIKASRTKIKT